MYRRTSMSPGDASRLLQHRRVTGAFAALLCCLSAHSAFASGADAAHEMNRLNEEGFVEFRAGRYARAAELFRAAYEVVADPGLQKNEAIAWFKAGRCDRAMPVANAFLIESDPTLGEERLEARSILANCRVELARAAMSSGNLELARTLLDDAESLQPDSYASDQIAMARVQLAHARHEPAPDTARDRSTSRTVGWVLVGTGSALLAASVTYWLVADDPATWVLPVGAASGAAVGGLGVFFVVTGTGTKRQAPTAGVTYRW